MGYRVEGRAAELLYQTGETEFKMRLDNGEELVVDVMAIEVVADVVLATTFEPSRAMSDGVRAVLAANPSTAHVNRGDGTSRYPLGDRS